MGNGTKGWSSGFDALQQKIRGSTEMVANDQVIPEQVADVALPTSGTLLPDRAIKSKRKITGGYKK
jgi:hypothetical protein